jgi:hypothetical protein
MRQNKGYRVNAFVPQTAKGDDLPHEFRFRSPRNLITTCKAGYRFELLRKGLETSCREPYVDRGWDDVYFSVDEWAPDFEKYFVSVELPVPDAISYIPPLYPVMFQDNRRSYAPLTHVLEYRMDDADDVRLHTNHSPDCGKNKNVFSDRPLPAEELSEEYKALFLYQRDQAEDPTFSQRRYIFRCLEKYARVFFLGVGLQPGKYNDMQVMDHVVRFFNKQLLPAIFQHRQPPYGPELLTVGRSALPWGLGQPGPSPTLTSAVLQYPMQRPHLQDVVSNENCSAPAATVIAGAVTTNGH